MRPAEFKTLRERLALSDADVANHIAGVIPRTVRHWESGRRKKVPDDVAKELQRLDALVERATLEALDLALDAAERHGMPESIDLVRYRTPEAAAELGQPIPGVPDEISFKIRIALLRRTMGALERAGFTVSIELVG